MYLFSLQNHGRIAHGCGIADNVNYTSEDNISVGKLIMVFGGEISDPYDPYWGNVKIMQ